MTTDRLEKNPLRRISDLVENLAMELDYAGSDVVDALETGGLISEEDAGQLKNYLQN